MEDTLYWIIEYIKVLLSYTFLMYIWPSAVFRKYLKGKSVTFRFGFCTTVQIVLVSTVVLGLGLLNILNRGTMAIIFYGVFVLSFWKKIEITENMRKRVKGLLSRTFGWKHMLLLTGEYVKAKVIRTIRRIRNVFKGHILEYAMLLVVVLYGMIYISWGPLHDPVYGFTDIPVHHSWIYGLTQGKPFHSGIYPEGMHCFIYAIYAMTGVRIYSCLMYIGGVNIAATIVAIYCLAKEIFRWKYSATFALIVLFTINMTCMNQITSMARLQCALPQEFGFPALYLCAAFLIRFLKKRKMPIRGELKQSRKQWLKDTFLEENLVVFCLALSGTIIVHFYTTIMAFYLCLGIAIVWLKRILSKKNFLPLVAAAMCGVTIAVAPMVIGFLAGYPLEGSLYWAMSVIKGSSNTTEIEIESESSSGLEIDIPGAGISTTQTVQSTETGIIDKVQGQNTTVNVPGESMLQNVNVPKQHSVAEKFVVIKDKVVELVKEKSSILYERGYLILFSKERARGIICVSIIIFVLAIAYRIVAFIWNLIARQTRIIPDGFDGYIMMILSSVFFVCAYTAGELGLPSLVEGTRTCFIGYSLVSLVWIMVLDILLYILSYVILKAGMQIISSVVAVGIAGVIYITGNFHGYLYYEVTRFSSVTNVTNGIIASLPENTYTLVSTTSELYQVIQYGRHEEWLTFMQNQLREKYTLPTEYVFLFVEKKPLAYAHWHFSAGPKWLGNNRYYNMVANGSIYPNYLTSEITEEYANSSVQYFQRLSDTYSRRESRTIIESKAYKWCMEFSELYPYELKNYYEDENFVCYYFKQNTKNLYDLAIE